MNTVSGMALRAAAPGLKIIPAASHEIGMAGGNEAPGNGKADLSGDRKYHPERVGRTTGRK